MKNGDSILLKGKRIYKLRVEFFFFLMLPGNQGLFSSKLESCGLY